MSITIDADPTDDPAFVAMIQRIVCKLDEESNPEEVYVIEIKNWFDHKWLRFSGIGRVPFHSPRDSHPQVALDEFYQRKTTFPPFTPNRVIREQSWAYASSKKGGRQIHRRQQSETNLQRRITQSFSSAIFAWFSSGTGLIERGCLMVYQVNGPSVSAWYASFRKKPFWTLYQTKEIPTERLLALMQTTT